jgi:hypothetical protein
MISQNFAIGNYERFLRVEIEDPYLSEIVSVYDAEGNVYYEVDYLTQNTVYVPVVNTQTNQATVENILKPVAVPRRFIVDINPETTELQFGYGTNDNEERLLDPTSTILHIFGKKYITDISFDPTSLIKVDKLGVVPHNTLLTVTYRRNTTAQVNTAAQTINSVISADITFNDQDLLNIFTQNSVRASLEVINEEPITGDVAAMDTEEIKLRSYGTYAAQNRAVTRDDYINVVYNMPSNFGTVRRAMITRDTDSFNGKNLNLYVISTDGTGVYTSTNSTIKQNLKTWINKHKMLGDTIDILDAMVINLEIRYSVLSAPTANNYDVIVGCTNRLVSYFADNYYDIGEPFKITDIYKILNNLENVIDTRDVTVLPVAGANYSDLDVSYQSMISSDGRYLFPPKNAVFEIKYPATDITGEVI